MKYVNKEIISSVVTGVLITLILYYFNRNDDIKVPLKTYIKTCITSTLLIIALLYVKTHFIDKQSLNGPLTTSNYQENISLGDPTF
tara:strand:+ start:390 stop:647 length:258 start_codon:yes stop_codon:yes gene_type:complete